MLGYFPDPYPDELFYSICARFSDRMQFSKRISAIQELFGRIVKTVADLPTHLETFINVLPPGHHYTISQVIDQHTLLPFYGPFFSPERLSKIRAAMQQDSRANVVQALVGNPQRNIHSIERLRFCPQCIIEDRQQFGECYWHRTHQVSCVKICPSHTTLLQESDVRVTKRVYPWDFISAERGIQMEQVRFDRTLLYQEILYRIARDVSWLLNQPELVYGPDLLYEQYQVHLFNKGIASCTKKVNVKALGQFFSSYYPPDLLQLLHCELDLTTRDHWLIDLIHNNRRSYYPLCHLLLIQVLGCSAENFFCAPAQPIYFGDGPWSCLNPVSDHYGEKRIENYRVTFKGSPDRSIKLIGTFACDCGFVYTREGPDRFSRSQFQITHIEAFGPTWELAFRRMWDDPTITIEQLASQLNISPHKLMRIAEQLNLPLRPKSKKKWKVLQRASANLTRSPHKPSNPEAYRTLWLQGMAENPDAGITELRTKLRTPFVWLRVHDLEWLNKHKPPSKRKQPIRNWLIDWGACDFQISEAVRSSAQQLKSGTGYPVRVTTNAIEGRKYSESRIGEEAAACVEWTLLSLILADDLSSVGLKEDHCRRSEGCISGRKGS